MIRSKHSLSHSWLGTLNQGYLVPVATMEVLPGDTIQHATSLLVRTQPLVSPVMHPVHVRLHHWFVPYRLIWDDFQNFITGGPNGADASVPPYITTPGAPGTVSGSLHDYLGVPTGAISKQVSALPFRAYDLIWNEFYRDQDISTATVISKASGADVTTETSLEPVCWEKDYFTTCRAWTQKGPAVTLPLGTSAPVKYGPKITGAGESLDKFAVPTVTAGSVSQFAYGNTSGVSTGLMANSSSYDMYADLSSATAASINLLRRALAIQKYEEARARYGSRYTEYLRYLGVRSSDARLQRPEYLGGGRQTIQFSEVLQTGVTTSGTPGTGVGSMLGHGIGAMRSNRYRRFFEEHGLVLSLLSVLPKTIYANGLPRMWSRTTKEDFFQRELQHIGQQEVKNKEVYVAHATPEGTFGYQDRYDEYRRMESTVHGEFRESALNFWHMARIFGADPALNTTFIHANPTNRIYQSTGSAQLYVMAMHSIQARRLVAAKGNPSV